MGLGRSNCSGTGREVPVEGCNGALLQKTIQIQIIDVANRFIPITQVFDTLSGTGVLCNLYTLWNKPGLCDTEDNLVLVPSKILQLVHYLLSSL